MVSYPHSDRELLFAILFFFFNVSQLCSVVCIVVDFLL